MSDSVYKVIELVGTSTETREKAAAAAVNRAGETFRELCVAEEFGFAGRAQPRPAFA
jgi:dodecin